MIVFLIKEYFTRWKFILTLLFLGTSLAGLSQKISGVIIDAKTKKPIEDVSIYFDNTTIGTSSDLDGEFTLKYPKELKTPLIISFIGYKIVVLDNFSTTERLEIYLERTTNILDEVVLVYKDTWSRELKLKEFRKHYLGQTKNGLSCKILNEKDLILTYNEEKMQLTARSDVPLYIENNNLKYLITVKLQNFEVSYSSVSKNKKHLQAKRINYFGKSFYKSLEEYPSNDTQNKRKKAYFGSVLHFMRSLASDKLKEEKFKIFPKRAKEQITVTPVKGTLYVKVQLKGKVNVLFKGKKLSVVRSELPEFYINKFGNYWPNKGVVLGGDFGTQRMGDTLPLDFLL